jgi:GDP/UDP-N,N'-diacetylbacillosamine 2-epimerase (hydrolysing)
MRKICVITTNRAEYGLLYWLMKGIQSDPFFQLQLVVTGAHLSPEFGSTIDRIREDGFKVDRSFDLELFGDKALDINHSLALAIEGFGASFQTLRPDLIVILGDRFEILGAATSALIANIPVAHLHGGELSEGAIDDAIRHAVTKLSHLHFAAAEPYRNRIIQLGEQPDRVFMVGGLGIDNINKINLLPREDLEKAIGIKFKKHNLLITYHPETLDPEKAGEQIGELLSALDQLTDTSLIFTMPNADTGHRIIIQKLQSFVQTREGRAILIPSMGQLNYLSTMKQVDAVVGNSSSGIIEAPSFRIGTINIGKRQDGRIRAASVIDCDTNGEAILSAVTELFSPEFQEKLKTVENPYGTGGAADKIIEVLKKVDLDQLIIKRFYSLPQHVPDIGN